MKYFLDKEWVYKLCLLIEHEVIDYKRLIPWCDSEIERMDNPPFWMLVLSFAKSKGEVVIEMRQFIWADPLLDYNAFSKNDFIVVCKLFRYEKKEITWKDFLLEVGRLTDGRGNIKEECEYYYAFLNEYEDRNYALKVEGIQINLIKSRFAKEIKEFEEFNVMIEGIMN